MLLFLLVKGNKNLNDLGKTHNLNDAIQFYEMGSEMKSSHVYLPHYGSYGV